ncbi:GntR family transcriptional regulator [Pantoea stewartii]|uniref:GntR family transcriptional regulator n=1 Tax=Pantoea stewartii TaxID=66269 RepID=UPI0005423D10|nr:GntR family transcriptional regulator [Pantoea stewartii]KHE00966.1 GntR family transcriptional regulator [Pantoea stewartii]KHN58551.1 GntR family transcriptional regulator [Pantoea stewartii]
MIPVRYLIVARKLSDAIKSGEYPVGTLLPTEHELSGMFQVSRSTIRAAIACLQEQGLVSRKKRVGTRVEASSSQKGYSQTLGSVADLVHLAKTQKREVKEVELFVAEKSQAGCLGLEPGGKYIRISSIRTDSEHPEKPVCWTEVYVEEQFASVVPLAKERKGELIAAIIEAEFGLDINTIEQRIEAVLVTQEMSKALSTPAGEPALKITRVYRAKDFSMMVMSVTVHPHERFALIMKLERDKTK